MALAGGEERADRPDDHQHARFEREVEHKVSKLRAAYIAAVARCNEQPPLYGKRGRWVDAQRRLGPINQFQDILFG